MLVKFTGAAEQNLNILWHLHCGALIQPLSPMDHLMQEAETP